MTHEIKTLPSFFEAVARGEKTAEIRENDRGYRVGDTLILREWNDLWHDYTGRSVAVRVTHVVTGGKFGIENGYVVLSIALTSGSTDSEAGSVATMEPFMYAIELLDTRDHVIHKYFERGSVYRSLPPEERDEACIYQWTEGNYACDCSRSLFLYGAEGELPCPQDEASRVIKLLVIWKKLQDGRWFPIHTEPPNILIVLSKDVELVSTDKKSEEE